MSFKHLHLIIVNYKSLSDKNWQNFVCGVWREQYFVLNKKYDQLLSYFKFDIWKGLVLYNVFKPMTRMKVVQGLIKPKYKEY